MGAAWALRQRLHIANALSRRERAATLRRCGGRDLGPPHAKQDAAGGRAPHVGNRVVVLFALSLALAGGVVRTCRLGAADLGSRQTGADRLLQRAIDSELWPDRATGPPCRLA